MIGEELGRLPDPLRPSLQEDDVASFVLAACVLLGSSRCPASDELQSLETKHYVLHTTGRESARSELGRILEAAYAGFGEIYGRLPQRHERLAVVVFEDADAWRAGLDARGLVPPEGLSDLWFRAEDEVLYTCGPLGAWQTRSLVLQGAWQQFHFACKKKNEDLVYNWYVTGIGLHVSMHRWDGERLQLGVLPR